MSKLTPPIGPDDRVLGTSTAAVSLAEYGDYECPFCALAHHHVRKVIRDLEHSMRFAFRHLPLAQAHPHALMAAEAAEAAGAQGSFWRMHDMLFENQHALGFSNLIAYATVLNLDVERFASELEQHVHLEKVRRDFRSGAHSGVNGTPTFFIDGERFDGSWEADSLEAAVMRRQLKGGELKGRVHRSP
jgi:protein-disulfide isomerase